MKKSLNKEQIQNICYGILDFISKVCDSNNIKYYLAFGTCLGAVRHQGFIPWDDDVDIYMLREDYRKFSKLMATEYKDSRYKLYYYDITPQYQQPLPKVCDSNTSLVETSYKQCPIGVYVDVFILDKVPEDLLEREKFYCKILKMQKGWSVHYVKPLFVLKRNGVYSWIKHLIKMIFFKKYTPKQIDQFCQSYNSTDSNFVGNMTEPCYSIDKITLDINLLKDGVKMKFGENCYPCPFEYDKYLTQVYGDYMQLPPENKRVYHFSNIAYFKK